jgi:hypothetical protein
MRDCVASVRRDSLVDAFAGDSENRACDASSALDVLSDDCGEVPIAIMVGFAGGAAVWLGGSPGLSVKGKNCDAGGDLLLVAVTAFLDEAGGVAWLSSMTITSCSKPSSSLLRAKSPSSTCVRYCETGAGG